MLTTTVALASTTAMAFNGRWTSVRGHTQFVGMCAEQTRQSRSKISSLASPSVRQLCQTCAKNTRNNTNKHIFAHRPTVCVEAFSAFFTKMCGWLVVISRCVIAISNDVRVAHEFRRSDKTLRQHYVKRFFVLPISCKATCRHPILSRNPSSGCPYRFLSRGNHRFLNLDPKSWPTGLRWTKPDGGAFLCRQFSVILERLLVPRDLFVSSIFPSAFQDCFCPLRF